MFSPSRIINKCSVNKVSRAYRDPCECTVTAKTNARCEWIGWCVFTDI